MRDRILILTLLVAVAFAGIAVAAETPEEGMVNAPATVAPEPAGNGSVCKDTSDPALATDALNGAVEQRCPYFQCVNSCQCALGCESVCISIQWCECECVC